MRFLKHIKKVPTPCNKEAGDAIALLFSSQPTKIKELIRGVGGCSPYLKGLLEIEYNWVLSALTSQESNPLGMEFNSDGTKVFLVGTANKRLSASIPFLAVAKHRSIEFPELIHCRENGFLSSNKAIPD